jgi:hypothetical protein
MWGHGPPKDNAESCKDIYLFIEEYPENDVWTEWKIIARSIVSSLENFDLVANFRIGQSMHDIIFSTLDHHRLTTEPRVTISIDSMQKTVRVAYSHANISFSDPDSEQTHSTEAAIPGILSCLRRLWIETKSGAPIPEALKNL